MSAYQLGHLLDAVATRNPEIRPVMINRLSPRETEVCRMACVGMTNKEIASHLKLSIKTIEKQRQQVNFKLNAHHPIQMVRGAIAKGYITISEWLETVVELKHSK